MLASAKVRVVWPGKGSFSVTGNRAGLVVIPHSCHQWDLIFFQPAERFGLKFCQLLPLVKTQMNKFATLVNPVVKNNYNDDDGALGLGFFRVFVSPRISCCCSSFPIIYMMRMIMIIIAINFTIISDQVVNGSRAAKHKVEIPPLL